MTCFSTAERCIRSTAAATGCSCAARDRATSRCLSTDFRAGCAVSDRLLFVTSGNVSGDRAGRVGTEAHLFVIDRETLQVRSHQSLGKYGNPCDITLVDDRDFTDEPVMAR